jgi:hypothetical protein
VPQGIWNVRGLKDARLKYFWDGKDFDATTKELESYSGELQQAIQTGSNSDALSVVNDVRAWGGVNNSHRQRGTFDWLVRNRDTLCEKIADAVRILKDHRSSLERFDGGDLIMNSAITKIVSLADSEEKLVIYDSRVAAALAYFAVRFAEERKVLLHGLLRFAVANEKRRNPSTAKLQFDSLFGDKRDLCHAAMVRLASAIIQRIAPDASPREIEAALFMWGYDVSG